MAFWTFRKQEKEVADMATTDEKERNKAKEDIAEKGKDSQTERDREDESVAAQERERGEEDSQTAKDRIDESEGAEKADEPREEEAHGDEKQDAEMIARMVNEAIEPLRKQITELSERLAAVTRNPAPASENEVSKLRMYEQKFMN